MLYYGQGLSPALLYVPLFLSLSYVTALGAGLWLSALNVRYRDIRFAAPSLVQLWLFATPVAYPSSLISEPWRTVYGLNPMVGVIDGFRWALLGTQTAPGYSLAVSCAAAFLLAASGLVFFRLTERWFADYV
jgi:lipopolysaccharide transport system permease protein